MTLPDNPQRQQKSPRWREPFAALHIGTDSDLWILVHCNDFFFVVRTTSFANSVRHHKSTTFAAFYKVRSRHFPVCSSLIASCFGRFILRTNGHSYTSLNLLNISLIAAIRGSSTVVSQSQVWIFRFAPQRLQIPLQSSLHSTRIGHWTMS